MYDCVHLQKVEKHGVSFIHSWVAGMPNDLKKLLNMQSINHSCHGLPSVPHFLLVAVSLQQGCLKI